MSYAPDYDDRYEREFSVADSTVDTRVAFLRRVYLHVFGAISLLVGLLALMTSVPAIAEPLMGVAVSAWWMLLLAFMAVSWIAEKMAYSGASVGTQYAGLGLYTLAEAVILTPICYLVIRAGMGHLLGQAAVLTLMVFGGLSAVVFFTKADFSFLGAAVKIGGFLALGIVALSIFGVIEAGTWFSVGMIVLLAGTILYQTSEIFHRFPPTAHVAASLALFASVATLFFYILRLLIALQSND